jgi:hypothetical protein
VQSRPSESALRLIVGAASGCLTEGLQEHSYTAVTDTAMLFGLLAQGHEQASGTDCLSHVQRFTLRVVWR